MTIEVTLTEYETGRVQVGDRQARRLAASGLVGVTPDPEPGWWRVTPGAVVGSLVVDDLRLLIRPKIRPENLFLLLEVGLPEKAWRREAFDYATGADLLPAVISFFARTVETTLARGVLRSYRERRELLVGVRGRIEFAEQAGRGGLALPTPCRFDDFTADITENRYLKTAVRRALRVPRVPPEDRQRLMKQLVALEEVDDTPLAADRFDHVVFTRLNQHYEPALRLARLLLANLTLVDQAGSTTAASFMVDMNDLFQRFVTERLRRALRGRLDVLGEPTVYLDVGGRVRMNPDLVFRRRGQAAYVGDIKYKLAPDARARSGDYYQLLAYTTAMDLPEGVLIYCLADGEAAQREVTVHHTGKVLHTYVLNLSGPPVSVQSEVDVLADWITERSERSKRYSSHAELAMASREVL